MNEMNSFFSNHYKVFTENDHSYNNETEIDMDNQNESIRLTKAKDIEYFLKTFHEAESVNQKNQIINSAIELYKYLQKGEPPLFLITILSNESYLTLIQLIQSSTNPEFVIFASRIIACITFNENADLSFFLNIDLISIILKRIYQNDSPNSLSYFFAIFNNFAADENKKYSKYAYKSFLSSQEAISSFLSTINESFSSVDLEQALKNLARTIFNLINKFSSPSFSESILNFIHAHKNLFFMGKKVKKLVLNIFRKMAQKQSLNMDQFLKLEFPQSIISCFQSDTPTSLVLTAILAMKDIFEAYNHIIYGNISVITEIAKNNQNNDIFWAAIDLLIAIEARIENLDEFQPLVEILSQDDIILNFDFKKRTYIFFFLFEYMKRAIELGQPTRISSQLIHVTIDYLDETEDSNLIKEFIDFLVQLALGISDISPEQMQLAIPFLQKCFNQEYDCDVETVNKANIIFSRFFPSIDI